MSMIAWYPGDTWQLKRERAAARVKEETGQAPRQVVDFQQVLTMDDIDAVIIGTPDHLHGKQLADAARAGKHVYIEKPIAMNMQELVEAYDAVKKHNVVVQQGTQMRSYPTVLGAKEFIAAGKLGRILKVEQGRNGNTPYWQSYGGEAFFKDQPTQKDVAWKLFLGDRPDRPFSPQQYMGWYGYRDFSSGPHTNLMAHFIDLVHYVTGASIPSRVVAMGGTYRWKDDFTAPDSVEVAVTAHRQASPESFANDIEPGQLYPSALIGLLSTAAIGPRPRYRPGADIDEIRERPGLGRECDDEQRPDPSGRSFCA